MNNRYIDIPQFTTLEDIAANNFSLSATQYKSLCIPNKNVLPLSAFLDRMLARSDLGSEVGSESYVETSPYTFIKTKALQPETYLLDINRDSVEHIMPKDFINSHLKKGDILISKDSNVGEAAILEKDYPNSMLCGGIYKLPVTQNKYYVLAFVKSDLFRQQIDFLVPRGSTIRHGKKKFLDCKIPVPNANEQDTIQYVEALMRAIVNKEVEIHRKHNRILNLIESELIRNQLPRRFQYSLPTIQDIGKLDRLDSSLYSEEFKKNEFLITNYAFGTSNVKELGFRISRGQNLQVSNIGKSVYTKQYRTGYYTLALPKFLSKYGTITETEYLGNANPLKTLQKGDIIFGAEGNEKGRSLVVIDPEESMITNIHGITLNQPSHDIWKGIFVKLFLDYYRDKGMIDAYAVGGNGGSLAIKYWGFLKFPRFPQAQEEEITLLYHNPEATYIFSGSNMDKFCSYDEEFNKIAGIYELDKSRKLLQKLLDRAINDIAYDIPVTITFQ